MSCQHRTRAWESEGESSTIVQFRNDQKPMVWLYSNLGWVPIGNTPEDEKGAEAFAEHVADSYGLVEVPTERAEWLAGWVDDEYWYREVNTVLENDEDD